jgi:hypothetical protein
MKTFPSTRECGREIKVNANLPRIKRVKNDLQELFFISENLDYLFPGGLRKGEIPDPIPNSEVKPFIADGTAHKSVEE